MNKQMRGVRLRLKVEDVWLRVRRRDQLLCRMPQPILLRMHSKKNPQTNPQNKYVGLVRLGV